jgi:hypothetical protein
MNQDLIKQKQDEAAKLLAEAKRLSDEAANIEKQSAQEVQDAKYNILAQEFTELFNSHHSEYSELMLELNSKETEYNIAKDKMVKFSDRTGIPFNLNSAFDYFPKSFTPFMIKMKDADVLYQFSALENLTHIRRYPASYGRNSFDYGWQSSSGRC